MAKRAASFKVEGSGTGRTLWALQSVSAAASVQQLDMCQTPGCPPMCSFFPLCMPVTLLTQLYHPAAAGGGGGAVLSLPPAASLRSSVNGACSGRAKQLQ